MQCVGFACIHRLIASTHHVLVCAGLFVLLHHFLPDSLDSYPTPHSTIYYHILGRTKFKDPRLRYSRGWRRTLGSNALRN